MSAGYQCGDERRREAAAAMGLNGIDFVEVVDTEFPHARQKTVLVRCLRELPGAPLPFEAAIENAPRTRPVRVTWAGRGDAVPADPGAPAEAAFFAALHEPKKWLVLRTDQPGDHSIYTVRLSAAGASNAAPAGFDDQLTTERFSFKAECPSELDCGPKPPAMTRPPIDRDIDYLARDYASFRRLMLDRMSETVPQWTERNPADAGVALVELLAYLGDQMSYEQDAIATEAYLGTARRRVSVRRHAKLLDYPMHDGCNARVWVQVLVNADTTERLPAGTVITTAGGDDLFQTLHDAERFYAAHHQMPFHTWGDRDCRLREGATEATLSGSFPELRAGHALVFEEVVGHTSGLLQDADPSKRHVVRLTADAGVALDSVLNQPVTRISWGPADALPFTLRLSSPSVDRISVASGNIVLADHGGLVDGDPLPAATGGRFRPYLPDTGITQSARTNTQPIDPGTGAVVAARDAFTWDMAGVLPDVTLVDQHGRPWTAAGDLLGSDALARDFVVELEDDGRAAIRFGDDRSGMRPAEGTVFVPQYRVGNGARGNIGADALRHIRTSIPQVTGVRNPLPARGGMDPESVDVVKRAAPYAFRTLARAVTAADYVTLAEREPDVQRAAATLKWTGSWQTMFLTADPYEHVAGSDAGFVRALARDLERYRLAGYDLAVEMPRYVPLEIEMFVCVKAGYYRHEVQSALAAIFNNGRRPDGRPGLFHPDVFTFGQPVLLSPLYAAAQEIPGVDSVRFDVFRRLGSQTSALAKGILPIDRLEIPRLDNDPARPGFGRFALTMGGGR